MELNIIIRDLQYNILTYLNQNNIMKIVTRKKYLKDVNEFDGYRIG